MKWTSDQVIKHFDTNWNDTLADIALMSMWTVKELKELLLK